MGVCNFEGIAFNLAAECMKLELDDRSTPRPEVVSPTSVR